MPSSIPLTSPPAAYPSVLVGRHSAAGAEYKPKIPPPVPPRGTPKTKRGGSTAVTNGRGEHSRKVLHAPSPKLSLHESVLRRMQSLKRYRDSFEISADRGLLGLLSGCSLSLAAASKYIVKSENRDDDSDKNVEVPPYVIKNISSPHFGEEFEVTFPASSKGSNLARSCRLEDLSVIPDRHSPVENTQNVFSFASKVKNPIFYGSYKTTKSSKPIVTVTTWDGDLV